MSTDYILVTPCHNEEKNLPFLIDSVVKQKQKPKIWLIVNDASYDNSLNIIRKASRTYPWIHYLSLKNKSKKRDLSFRCAKVYKIGSEKIYEIAKSQKIVYEYLGILDADFILAENYFSDIVQYMNSQKKYGIVSGGLYYNIKGKLQWEKHPSYLPVGGARLIRKNCLDDINGLPIGYAPDTICEIKAIVHGWKLRSIMEVEGVQTRKTASAEGLWNGYTMVGESNHYLGYPLLVALLKSMKLIFKWPCYISLAYLKGYLSRYLLNAVKINDTEVLNYCQNEKLMERFNNVNFNK